jgi:hypothetical protein
MDPYGSQSHSFVVKVWLEESVEEAGEATWRGHVTHVPDQDRRYVHTLDDILDFIAPYLDLMGVQPAGYRRPMRRIARSRLTRD